MAKVTYTHDETFVLALDRMAAKSSDIAAKALYAGANIYADAIAVETDKILSANATGQMRAGFGISKVKRDRNMDWNVSIGFGGVHTDKRKKGKKRDVANAILAGALEHGEFIEYKPKNAKAERYGKDRPWKMRREAKWFITISTRRVKAKAEAAMKSAIENEQKRIMEES